MREGASCAKDAPLASTKTSQVTCHTSGGVGAAGVCKPPRSAGVLGFFKAHSDMYELD